MKTLIVIPTYNEEENILSLMATVFAVVPDVSILFVDDNSQDGTQQRIAEVQEKYPGKIDILKRAGKLGLGTAYIEGFKWGLKRDFDVFIEMDADLSHDPKYLLDFLSEIERYDAVFGSRYISGGGTKNWSWMRKFISVGGSIYARTILGMTQRDLTGGYNAWRRSVLESVDLDDIRSEGYAFQIELKYRSHLLGFRLKEIPIIFVDRRAGYSKMSHKIVIEAMMRVWTLRSIKRRIEMAYQKKTEIEAGTVSNS